VTTSRTPQQIGRANKAAGARLELETRKFLTGAGWLAVASKGSIGAADLIAIAPATSDDGRALPFRSAWAVQCKSNGYVPPMQRAVLHELADRYCLTPVVAYWHKEGRSAKRIRFRRLDGTEIEP
jgi:hypothetical protein